MTRSEIATAASSIIAEHLKVPLAKVTDDATFTSLGADSLDHIEIMFEAETAFDIEIGDDDAERLKTVGQAIDYLAKRLGADEAVAA